MKSSKPLFTIDPTNTVVVINLEHADGGALLKSLARDCEVMNNVVMLHDDLPPSDVYYYAKQLHCNGSYDTEQ